MHRAVSGASIRAASAEQSRPVPPEVGRGNERGQPEPQQTDVATANADSLQGWRGRRYQIDPCHSEGRPPTTTWDMHGQLRGMAWSGILVACRYADGYQGLGSRLWDETAPQSKVKVDDNGDKW